MKPNNHNKGVLWSQARVYVAFAVAWILVVFYISNPATRPVFHIQRPDAPSHAHYFHLVLAAPESSARLCKSTLSSAVLGYSSPSVVGWTPTAGQDNEETPQFNHDPKHPFITGAYDYLNRLRPERGEDLVLLIQSLDTWFQLRPLTLIDRYLEVIRRADALPTNKGDKVHHKIAIGAQRQCLGFGDDDSPCFATSQDKPDFYLNSGIMIGPVKDLMVLFGQAVEEIAINGARDDVSILNQIVNEQAAWREAHYEKKLSMPGRLVRWFTGHRAYFGSDSKVQVQSKADVRADKTFEFGVAVDVDEQISAVFEEESGGFDWRAASNTEDSIDRSPLPVSESSIASDINSTIPPFWTFSHEANLDRWRQWSDVSLITSTESNVVPAIVQYKASPSSEKIFERTAWERQWFYGHSRTLYDVSVYEPFLPIAKNNGREWWPAELARGGVRNGNVPRDAPKDDWWLGFDDICRDYHEELFGDGLGPWMLPANN